MNSDNVKNIATLTERLGRLLGSDAHASGLRPVQWEALRYLDKANRFSLNSTALTAYLGSTKGTVSQTIMALERKGLVSNQSDSKDRRRNRLALTAKGRKLLGEDPLSEWEDAASELSASSQASLVSGLRKLLSIRLDAQNRRPFGQCQSCAHFEAHHSKGDPHYCRLLQEKLSEMDSAAICYEQIA